MIFHVISLPHTQIHSNWSWCAYTEKVRKFATMMTRLGHTVYVYGGDQTDAECQELIQCIKNPPTTTEVVIPEWTNEYFTNMNQRAIKEIQRRLEKEDFICIIAGVCQEEIAQAFPFNMSVEFGIGYSGTFSPYRVFESYAWMHTVYGYHQGAMSANGRFYDRVIPNYFEIDQFPFGTGQGDYILFMGRIIERKGIQIALDVARRTDTRLVVAGQGEPPEGCEYAGLVGPNARAILMMDAKALIAPTLYVGPFEGVAVESQICGTPAITTDWGAFVETVEQGKTGFRCHTMAEFDSAVENAPSLDREYIRTRAIEKYSLESVSKMYESYFTDLMDLWGDGFNK